MAWITPVTDRTATAWHTLTDQNRIVGNVIYLTTTLSAHSLYFGRTISKTSYTYNDYISVSDWSNLLAVLSDLVTATSLEQTESLSSDMTWTTLNAVESLTLQIYERVQLLLAMENLNHFAGQGYYSRSDAKQIYSGGLQ